MHDDFEVFVEQDGEWFVASCPQIPEANGQGRTCDEAKSNLGEAIALILQDRSEDALS